MNHEIPLVLNVAVALAIAVAGGFLASWLRQSPIFGYLLAGVFIGPFTPGFAGNREQIALLADVGVIFLMFGLGVAFSLKDLARVRATATIGTTVQVVLTIAGGTVAGIVMGWGALPGTVLGIALAASSSMVILKTLLDRGEIASSHGRLLLSMAIVQDLIIVVLIVVLPQLVSIQAGGSPVEVAKEVGITILKATVFIGVSLAIGLRAVPWLMGHVSRMRSSELFIVTAAVLALGAASVSTLLGLSPALGAFVAGLLLSESEFDHRVISEVVPVRDLFATLFFVSVGMLIDLNFIVENWPAVLAVAGFTLLLKFVTTAIGIIPFRLTARTAAFTALGMIPVGELNFVLAQIGLQTQALSPQLYNLILTSALVTIVLTPSAFSVAPRLGEFILHNRFLRHWFDTGTGASGEGAQLEAHAIVIGYGRVGQSVARGLRDAGISVAVIDSRLSRVRDGVADGLPAIYGNAFSPTVLEAAHVANARLAVVALPDFAPARAAINQLRELNPSVVIAARAEQSVNEPALRAAGAHLVIVPELAGATALLHGALDMLGAAR
ncbi:cation:proton antiporter [Steroidobacter sp.]|uniref:cation:proton antiporter n=1 Tax=Steroidobacter sp. TaxID=1978227 RepID=UPI001A5C3502|nr:cation:proton antiporter [Steroidobacter sp.]MBL8268192.1 cation:proton antiporter [Steroidobacter sp.]